MQKAATCEGAAFLLFGMLVAYQVILLFYGEAPPPRRFWQNATLFEGVTGTVKRG